MEGVIPPLYPARDTMGFGLQVATADSRVAEPPEGQKVRWSGDRAAEIPDEAAKADISRSFRLPYPPYTIPIDGVATTRVALLYPPYTIPIADMEDIGTAAFADLVISALADFRVNCLREVGAHLLLGILKLSHWGNGPHLRQRG